MIDPFRQEGDLDIGGTRVLIVKTVPSDDLAFRSGSHELKRNTYANWSPSQCRKMPANPVFFLRGL